MDFLQSLGTVFLVMGILGLIIIGAGIFYIKKYPSGAGVIDLFGMLIGLFYKYVIGATAALLIIGTVLKLSA